MQKPLPSERSFGLSVGSVLVVLGGIAVWRHKQTLAPIMLGTGSVLLILGLVAPSLLRVPNKLWMRFAHALGWVNARILLTLFFAVILTPVGVVMRLLGRNPLAGAGGTTNWTPYPARHGDAKHFDRMF